MHSTPWRLFLQREQNRKIEKKEDKIIISKSKLLEEHFMNVKSKQERNQLISLAYLEDGYSQIEIANYLGLSKSAVSMVIKRVKSGDWTAGVYGSDATPPIFVLLLPTKNS